MKKMQQVFWVYIKTTWYVGSNLFQFAGSQNLVEVINEDEGLQDALLEAAALPQSTDCYSKYLALFPMNLA